MKPSEKSTLKLICDAAVCMAGLTFAVLWQTWSRPGFVRGAVTALVLICVVLAGADLIRSAFSETGRSQQPKKTLPLAVRELLLLDENGKPLKSWNLTGKTSLIIGKKNRDEEADVDLGDCEYGAFVEPQHALLNFAGERWYLEDISEGNGVRVKKAQDGISYKVLGRPCEVGAGDVIYIAKTRLLLT